MLVESAPQSLATGVSRLHQDQHYAHRPERTHPSVRESSSSAGAVFTAPVSFEALSVRPFVAKDFIAWGVFCAEASGS